MASVPVQYLLEQLDSLRAGLDAALSEPEVRVPVEALAEDLKSLWAEGETRELAHANQQNSGLGDVLRRNYFAAINRVYSSVLENQDISENLFKELHRTLFEGVQRLAFVTDNGKVEELDIEPGEYRHTAIYVESCSEKKFFMSPESVPRAMQELLAWCEKERGHLHPVELASRLAAKFTFVHPFPDGNGRVSRLVASLVLMAGDYPPYILEARDGDVYDDALRLTDENGDYEPLVRLVASNLIRTTMHLLRRMQAAC